MRICQVTPYDLSYDGGVNRHVITLAQALQRLGHEVHVLGPASGAVPPCCDGLPGVVSVRANGSRARVGLLVSRRAVRRYLEERECDLVHVHEPWVPGTARAAVRWAAAPIVATFHAYIESESHLKRTVRRVLVRPLERVSAAIAVSDLAAASARRMFHREIAVVPNGIDPAVFAAPSIAPDQGAPKIPPRDPGPLRLLFVGRFDEPRKGLPHFLRAASLLRRRGVCVEAAVVGSGDPRPFQGPAQAANARFLGRVSEHTLVEMYRWCDVFCASSTHGESFGIVLIEAMASGRPVVASDIPGYRNAALDAAILVPAGDAAAFADAIRRAADDDVLRRHLVRKGWERAQQLAWSRLVQNISAVYEQALANRLAGREALEMLA